MELIKQSAYYVLARGGPGLINLLALMLFTRLLEPDAYGEYILVVTSAALGGALAFQWLRLSLLRFLPAADDVPKFMSTVLAGFLAVVGITAVAGGLVVAAVPDATFRALIVLSAILMWIECFYSLNLEIYRAKIKPRVYGWLSFAKSMLAMMLGAALAWFGGGALGVLLGAAVGMILPVLWCFRECWGEFSFAHFDSRLFRELLGYGMPLTATFAFAFIVSSSDRFFIAGFLGTSEAGLYAVGYDLAKQSLGMLMMIVNLAAYPLAVRALDLEDRYAVEAQLSQNFLVLLSIGLPSMVGLVLLSGNISAVFLGQSFRESAAYLIPWISVATFLACIKSYYVDISFQLGKKTTGQMKVVAVAALINVLLNIALIPRYGLMGAAYATVAAYAIGLLYSIHLGRSVFPLPFPGRSAVKVVVATFIMMAGLWPIKSFEGPVWLTAQISAGAFLFLGSLCAFNFREAGNFFGRHVKFWCTAKALDR